MIFNSLEFLIFGLLFFALWPFFRKGNNSRWGYITAASFVFYGWWDWRFLFLIIGSGLIDYFCGLAINSTPSKRKFFLGLSLFGNLGSLSVFKYSSFFAHIIEDAFALINVHINLIDRIPEFALILPVGISFYTFQSMSYTIDIYNGKLKPTKNILHFFSYLSMFPQLVAGPIVRARDFLKQLSEYRIPSPIQQWNALKLIVFGLFQKMVIADNLSYLIDSAFEQKSPYQGTLFWWVIMIAFSFQIYCDFSGYSSIARGLAKMMGYHFKMNFNHPYISKSMREFWSRWHISLSTWFRDYVYIPLGGSRKGRNMGLLFLSITMLVSGLWHGANYTFIVWGGIHAFYIVIERLTGWPRSLRRFPILLTLIIFVQSMLAWVYFRANDMQQGNEIMGFLLNPKSTNLQFISFYFNNLFFLLLAIGIEMGIYVRKNSSKYSIWIKQNNFDIYALCLAIIGILFFRGEGQQFIYFQF